MLEGSRQQPRCSVTPREGLAYIRGSVARERKRVLSLSTQSGQSLFAKEPTFCYLVSTKNVATRCCVCYYSQEDVNKHLLAPDREAVTGQSKDTTKVNFGEQALLEFLTGAEMTQRRLHHQSPLLRG